MAQKEAIEENLRSLPNALKTGFPTGIRTWNLLINSQRERLAAPPMEVRLYYTLKTTLPTTGSTTIFDEE